MLELVVILKALCEIAGFALLAQGLLYVLAGQKRDNNFVYYIFKTVTAPIMKAVRFITPRFVIDRHIGYVAFLLVVVVWFFALMEMASLCRGEYRTAPACAKAVEALGDRVQPPPN